MFKTNSDLIPIGRSRPKSVWIIKWDKTTNFLISFSTFSFQLSKGMLYILILNGERVNLSSIQTIGYSSGSIELGPNSHWGTVYQQGEMAPNLVSRFLPPYPLSAYKTPVLSFFPILQSNYLPLDGNSTQVLNRGTNNKLIVDEWHSLVEKNWWNLTSKTTTVVTPYTPGTPKALRFHFLYIYLNK